MTLESLLQTSLHVQPVPPALYAFVRREVSWADVPRFFETEIKRIAQALIAQNTPPQYSASLFIHNWNATTQIADLSAAIQTNVPVAIEGGGTIEFPAGDALTFAHWGAANNTHLVHAAMSDLAAQNQLTISVVIEEYRTNPLLEPNPSKWLTWIIYRIYDGNEVPRIIS
jgi:hypothetical protein